MAAGTYILVAKKTENRIVSKNFSETRKWSYLSDLFSGEIFECERPELLAIKVEKGFSVLILAYNIILDRFGPSTKQVVPLGTNNTCYLEMFGLAIPLVVTAPSLYMETAFKKLLGCARADMD